MNKTILFCMVMAALLAGCVKQESYILRIEEQGSFAVGGTVLTDSLGRTFHGDHAYVFYQKPVDARRYPLVFAHGVGQFSKTWETTPDGREGFQNIFLRRGFATYLVDRQFITRENANHDILTRFENLLDDYFASGKAAEQGMPSVQQCADALCLSANYFSDLVKKETGMSALKHIRQKMLDVAKERVFDTSKSISEISYELGFPYPQHFSRWFKKMAGCTPNEYRMLNA